MEDKELIAKLLDPTGSEAAFRLLISTYKRPLYAQVRSIVGNHDDADDALQNTFIKVFRYIRDFKGDAKLFSWMYRIATNEALALLRERKRKSGSGSPEFQQHALSGLTSGQDADGDEIEAKLRDAIARLPEKQKLVFEMKYYQEMKYEQMSEILGTSVGALKASYHHAVKKIEAYVTRQMN